MNFGVVVFPGTWSDCDFHYMIGEVLHQSVRYVWHRDANLAGLDCLVLPGGFSFGGGDSDEDMGGMGGFPGRGSRGPRKVQPRCVGADVVGPDYQA